MWKSLCVGATLLIVAPYASGEIFKCVGASGRITYQNFPCNVDSIGSHAIAAAPQVAEPSTDANLPLRRGQLLSATRVQTPSTPPGEPGIGMTREQVRATHWGQPVDVTEQEEWDGWKEVWTYDSNRRVEFNRRGRVQAVQR
ncbi:MAG TPA: DUF4124 domain-containing protein [Casimicrobiaceae bacterium]|nr:DUF4124 domain-containing protein [Casimicrobiaceae bacterium]